MLWKELLFNIKGIVYLKWDEFKLYWSQNWTLYDSIIINVENSEQTTHKIIINEQDKLDVEMMERINEIYDNFHLEMHDPSDDVLIVDTKQEEDNWVFEHLYI